MIILSSWSKMSSWSSYNNFSVGWGLMDRFSGLFYNSVKTSVVIRGVMYSSKSTVGFSNSVISFNYISITNFMLGFVVSSVMVIYFIVKFVFRSSIIVLTFVSRWVSIGVHWSGIFGYDWGGIFGYDWGGIYYGGSM